MPAGQPEAELKTLIKWAALAVVVAAVLVIAREPLYWQRRLAVAAHGSGALPQSFYTPRAVVRGGNQPPVPRETPDGEHLDAAALQTAAEYAEKQQSRALIVTRHGYIVFEKYWQGSNLDTVVESSGLGRVVAALATGAAISDRKIGWPDEPIGYLVPALSKDKRGEITVRNLLQMSSGLGPSASPYSANIINRYLNLPSQAPPGTRWLDQGVDPDLLAYVIQTATGQPYADYMSQAIWKRIGAGDAWIWLDSPGGDAHVDTGFYARQGDWLRVAELLLQNGNYQGDEVVLPRWVPELLKPVQNNPNYGSYLRLGAHQGPGVSPYATSDVLVVEGGANRMWLVPSLQIAILRTGDQLASDWDDSRIPNLIIRGARDFVPAAAQPGADLRQLVPNH
jgi:CubicO group peptidase (beta-lactamase class C family)